LTLASARRRPQSRTLRLPRAQPQRTLHWRIGAWGISGTSDEGVRPPINREHLVRPTALGKMKTF